MKVLYNNNIWDKDAICALLDRSDAAVGRALMMDYANRSAKELR